ncbi:OmpA family protein [Methylibium sp.]|uniref:OmpA family protein n=1 Tax=Methylibium sp. TaxID=2067992 RepID=UPI0017F9B7AD|nr:OmpA family protein [Methylibium sp.]MBA3591168.1 OmpA family protein [Methylibium sp.]
MKLVPTHAARAILALSAATLLAGCQNMSEREAGTAKGAGIGAAVGAVAGVLLGDSKQGAATGAAVGAIGGAIAGNVWSKKMEDKRRAMEQSTQGTGVDVTRTADNQLKLNVPSDISFDTGRAAIKPELRTVLDSFASGLANDPNLRVRIIGHTDSTGSDAVNNPLSVQRAQSVRDYLAARGISPSRVETAGRGSYEPIADNTSVAGRAQNRRVEILLREPEQAAAAGQPRS